MLDQAPGRSQSSATGLNATACSTSRGSIGERFVCDSCAIAAAVAAFSIILQYHMLHDKRSRSLSTQLLSLCCCVTRVHRSGDGFLHSSIV